jgi:hypothetical protein
MLKCKVVYGPQACGKTANREVLMRKLDCIQVVDIEEAGDLVLLTEDTLVLTNQPMAGSLNYNDVMALN